MLGIVQDQSDAPNAQDFRQRFFQKDVKAVALERRRIPHGFEARGQSQDRRGSRCRADHAAKGAFGDPVEGGSLDVSMVGTNAHAFWLWQVHLAFLMDAVLAPDCGPDAVPAFPVLLVGSVVDLRHPGLLQDQRDRVRVADGEAAGAVADARAIPHAVDMNASGFGGLVFSI